MADEGASGTLTYGQPPGAGGLKWITNNSGGKVDNDGQGLCDRGAGGSRALECNWAPLVKLPQRHIMTSREMQNTLCVSFNLWDSMKMSGNDYPAPK